MKIAIGVIKTKKDIKYVRISCVNTKQEAALSLEYYVKANYKGEAINYKTIDINELEMI